ncbi:alpha/beta hydrolase [Alisedimentitalea sp. MJ-SS2]|uniref:alpha/beta hydrolase n=1 Tax=Aliisedimentitalea sp. MJ-SS2 TaxID=3049795 RepID=UPI00290CA5AD|nr:alpha/beta hydrolase [Alisedimentitalea sp. MJ-SS2]MDU8929249.1 alpha/beta hydrolase [Alisedimentitalea sp. MJ-SS2]
MHKLKIIWALIRVFLPEPLVRLLYLGRLPSVAGRRIDPKAQAATDLVDLLRDPENPPTLEESRAQLAAMAAKFERPCPPSVTKTNITLPGATSERPARIYTRSDRDPFAAQPTLLYLHGGGWVQGSIDSHDGLCGALANLSGVRVISFDYRLAPEHKFPAAPDDILTCYRALLKGAGNLNITPTQLAIGGDSAGGNLTGSLMHDLATSDLPMPAAQLLIYPGTDGRLTSQSMQDLAHQPLLPASRIDWYLSLYLPKGHDRTDPRFSTLLSPHHAGQPPALIIAGGHDPLWDDALSYARSLEEAGVQVTLHTYPGQIHAFVSLTRVIPQGRVALDQAAQWLKTTLAR